MEYDAEILSSITGVLMRMLYAGISSRRLAASGI